MITLLTTLFFACGDKSEDTALVETEPSTEPATEETGSVEDTGSETGDTGSSVETGSAE